MAKAEGYKALAITDHDTATAYPELKAACEKEGMECIFGVEFTVAKPDYYHITAFNFDPEYPPMKQYLADMGFRQTDNTKKCFELAVEKGDISGITWEEVLEFNKGVVWLCNDHVFRAMLAKGLIKQEEYVGWFDKNFLKQRSLFPPIINFKTTAELIKLVEDAGGFTCLAHPHNQLDDVPHLIELGLKGIEVSHSMLNEEESARALKIALENNLFISGGTDHEGELGGQYSSFPNEEELKKSIFYLEPLSVGVEEKYFREMQAGKLNR